MDKIYSLWWHKVTLPGHIKKQLLTSLQSIETIYQMTTKSYEAYGIPQIQALKIQESKRDLEEIKKYIEQCNKLGIQIISIEESCYPHLLKEIADPPINLFIKGDRNLLLKPMIAIVGSRKCTEYGFEASKKLAQELGDLGMIVVSGMARGIDEAAHKGAILNGKTVAVLGTGVDICYPVQNRKLYEDIQENGCVLSEFLPGTQGMPHHFPMRNRIISGMSIGTIVVEAEEKSGSLITANLALEQNREVFAIPGNVFSLFSHGTNKLIQAGAKLVINAQDILDEFPEILIGKLNSSNNNLENNKSIPLDKVEIMVYDCLSWQPIQIEKIQNDILYNEVTLSVQTLEMILLKLEIKGLVQRLPARRYSRMK